MASLVPQVADEGHFRESAALKAAIASADLRVLLMVLFQLSGDDKWLGFRPKRDVKLIADEDAGLPEEDQDTIRAAAFEMLSKGSDLAPAISDPGDALMKQMMDVCLGEDVPLEYSHLMREELGFVPRDVSWQSQPNGAEWSVLIVGAGVSGITLGARLERLGIAYTILERHEDVGGVWLENRYPGCGVDTPNHAYSFSFGRPYPWSRYFSTRDEIWKYLGQSADDFRVRPNIRFGCAVEKAVWDEASQAWIVTVTSPEGVVDIRTKVFVSAIGQFGLPSVPDIKGAGSFQGPAFHSAHWPVGLDITDKRVAIIGTGASAMQIVPTIVEKVAKVDIYQRTPQWVRPVERYHDDMGPARWLLDNVPLYAAWFRFTMWWRYGDGLLPQLRKDSEWPHQDRSLNARNDLHRVEMIAHIERELGERTDLVDKCIPSYPPFGKRILLDNGWYQAIKHPKAELITAHVTAIAPTGILTEDGVERDADIIIFATGFEIATMAARLNIQGRGGVSLREAWGIDNPRAFLGMAVPDFPNFFVMAGPNTGLGHGGSAIFQAESQARYISGMLVQMIENDVHTIDVKQDRFDEFVDEVDDLHDQLIWTHPNVTNYYQNSQGRVVSIMPFRLVDYWKMTHEPTLADYVIEN